MYVPVVDTVPPVFSRGDCLALYEGEIGIGLLCKRNCLGGEERA